ncbi:vWA domain-containing protein [Kallotenue papyrolyticum]|uniref:vWA domain-containing protein n=1 Tax=Kallotenue papyrolyticum TaxID=1325125 RepID=UPI000478609E|nr:VWA domain-containing protein [Kallotenue papyrolyticum]
MAGELHLRQTLARPYVPVTQTPQVAYVLIEIMPTATATRIQMPVNVAFVLDRSGSMRGNKLRAMQQAVGLALDRLNDNDTVSITIFNHQTSVLVPTTSASNRQTIMRLVGGIKDEGGTKIGRALAAGLAELARAPQDRQARLVLLTDGETDRDEAECLHLADQAGARGVPIMAFGIGSEWNDKLLTEIATRSHGEVEHLRRPEEIEDNFMQVVQQAQAAVFHNVTATVRLVGGVTPRAAWQVVPLIKNLGYKPLAERAVVVPLDQLENNARRVLLLELMVEPRAAGQYRIGQIEVAYDLPLLGLRDEKARADLLLTFTADQALAQQVNPQVMNIVEKVTAFKLQTRALEDVEAGNISGATQKLQGAVTRLLNAGETELAQSVQQEAQRLQQTGQLSSEGAKTIRFGARKTVRLSDLDRPRS